MQSKTAMSKHVEMPKIRPVGHRVLVRYVDQGEQSKGGIIIPDSAKEKPQEAEVMALGLGRRNEDGTREGFDVQVGNRVFVSKYGGSELKFDDQKYSIVGEDDILAILN